MPQPRLPFCEIQYMKCRRLRGAQLAPSERHSYRSAATRAGRIGSPGSCLGIVAKIVEIDAVLACCLCHLCNVKLRILPLKLERESMREFLDRRPLVIWPDGNNNVKPLPPGALHKTHKPHFRKPSLEFARRFRQSFPLDCRVRIEIEDDAIGLFE